MLSAWLVILYQSIVVNSTNPCFLNSSAGFNIFQNCGMGTDYIKAAVMPFEWVTGGWFSMILVSVFVVMTYIKYQKVVYPIMVGAIFLPISFFVFPAQFLSFAIIMAGISIGILVWYAFISQSNES